MCWRLIIMTDSTNRVVENQILKSIVDLDFEAKVRIYGILSAMVGQPQMQNASTVQAHEENGIDADEFKKVEEWLESISHQSSRKKIELIDAVLPEAQLSESIKLLNTARSEILNADIPLAARLAASNYAEKSPAMFVGALAGVGLAIFAVVKGVAKLLGY